MSVKQLMTLLFLVLTVTKSYGQEQKLPYRFIHLTQKNGLSKNKVTCIAQDTMGYIWLGTTNGLNRYDGYSLKLYAFNDEDSCSLSNNRVESLLVDSKNKIWVGTENGGLNVFDPISQKFKRYFFNASDSSTISSNHIYCLFEDGAGNIWIGTRNGFNKYLEKSDSFKRYFYNTIGNDGSNTIVTAIHSATDKQLWIGTYGKGLYRVDLKLDIVTNFNSSDENSINDNKVWAVYEDTLHKKLWIGTEKGALNVLNFKTQHFEYYGNIEPELAYRGSNVVRSIVPGLGDEIWIGTDGGGLYCLNHEEKYFYEYVNVESDASTLAGNAITNLYRDKNDMLWIGTVTAGVDRINLRQSKFYHLSKNTFSNRQLISNLVNDIFQDRDHNYWIGTEDGLIYSDSSLEIKQVFVENPLIKNSLSNDVINTITQTRDGRIWIGTYLGGVDIYNPKTGNITCLNNQITDNKLLSNFVRAIYEDASGNIWIGSIRGGLDRYNPKQKSIKHYNRVILSSYIMQIVGDKNDNLWIATFGEGLWKYNIKTKQVSNYTMGKTTSSIADNLVQSLVFENDSNLWIGTANGLNCLNTLTQKVSRYTKKDGLLNNEILSIVKTENNELWLGTNEGLSRFDLESRKIENFTEQDGLKNKSFNFNAGIVNNKGELLMGGNSGIDFFHPEEVHKVKHQEPLYFTELTLFNKTVNVGQQINGQVVLHQPLRNTKTLVLNHKNRVFSIYFSLFNFCENTTYKYEYRLKESPGGWINNGHGNAVYFNYMDYGRHTLQIRFQGADEAGYIAEINIVVKPPFYLSAWFIVIVVFFIIGAIVAYYFIRLYREKKTSQRLEQIVNEKTRDLYESNTRLEENQADLEIKHEEVVAQNEFIQAQAKKIEEQNYELKQHRYNLEKLVEARTQELVVAKNQAERADKLKTAFLANMSHEIRTPMNAILGFIELLDQPGLSQEDRNEFKKLINSSGHSLLNLINDIIDISRIESGQLKLYIEQFQPHEICEELHTIYKKMLKPDIHFECLIPEKISLKSDKNRITQVLNNLLSNAFKYTEKGAISFGYKLSSSYVEFFVRDTGVGIDNKELEQIFNRFYKIEGQEKVYRGTGLGLAISKQIVELLRGKIWVESVLGKGSTFYFIIPR